MAQNSGPSANVEHAHGWLEEIFQGFDAQLRGIVNTGAERHAGIHSDSESAWGRGIVAPLGDQEEARAYGDGLQEIARGLHPVAVRLDANGGGKLCKGVAHGEGG